MMKTLFASSPQLRRVAMSTLELGTSGYSPPPFCKGGRLVGQLLYIPKGTQNIYFADYDLTIDYTLSKL